MVEDEAMEGTRPVMPADHEEWLRMRMALWPLSTREELSGEITAYFKDQPDNNEVLVSPRADGGLQGMAELSIRTYVDGCFTNNVGYIEGWYVDPDMRGKGVGRALVRAAEQWARSRGCTEMASDTTLENEASQMAHQALGYRITERLVMFRKEL